MRRSSFLVLTVALFTLLTAGPGAAAKYGKKDLVGSWNGDVMAMLKASGMMDQMPPEFDASEFAAGFEITVTFHEDGTVTLYNKTFQGVTDRKERWEVTGAEDNRLTLKNVDDEGVEETVTVTFTDPDHITLTSGEEDMPPLQFTRAPKAEATEEDED